jgi:RimJ/RimL family protein N-acetyltransferase
VDHLVALDSDPEVMRFLSGGTPTPREEIKHDILPAFLRYYERGDRYGFWAAIERATGDFLGWFHFRPLPGVGPDEPELGYRLRKAAWGKGYGTEVSRALIRKGFTELGVRRVVASTYQDNVGSRRVMEKAGMTFVRTFRYNAGDPAAQELWEGDDVEYAIERADWERQAAAGELR